MTKSKMWKRTAAGILALTLVTGMLPAEIPSMIGKNSITASAATLTPITPTVYIANWYAGNTAKTPYVYGNTGNGAVTFYYKAQGAADSTYTTTMPTASGSYTIKAEIAATDTYAAGTATANFQILVPRIYLSVPEETVIAGLTAQDSVYTVESGQTITVYSDVTLTPNTENGLEIMTATNKAYGGKTYKYRFTVTFDGDLSDGTEYHFAHIHSAKSFSIDATHTDTDKVWVRCEGEPSGEAECVAFLDTDGTYFYGDAPKAEDVILKDFYGATASVTEFYFTKKGDTSGVRVTPENMEIGTNYVVNAVVSVNINGIVSFYALTRDVVFAVRPLAECEIYLVDGEDEILLDVTDGAAVVPAGTFTYDGTAKTPVIKVKNNVLGTENTLTENEYTGAITTETNAGAYTATLTAVEKDNAFYGGTLNVNWSIEKAEADIDVESCFDIIYDGQPLDVTDFVFTGAQADLATAENTTVICGTRRISDVLERGCALERGKTYRTLDLRDDAHENIIPTDRLSLPNGNGGYNDTALGSNLDTAGVYTYGGTNGQIYIDSNGNLQYNYNGTAVTAALPEGCEWFVSCTVTGNVWKYRVEPIAAAEIPLNGSDGTSVGNHVATITITPQNYKDVVLTALATIDKRPVTIIPDENQTGTFGDTAAPMITYTADPQNDAARTGFVATDAATAMAYFGDILRIGEEIETTNILNPAANDSYDYDDFANDAGTYSLYYIDAIFQNYDVTLADGGIFTVLPRSLGTDATEFTLTDTAFTYDGTPHSIAVDTLKVGGTALVEGVDYTLGGAIRKTNPGSYLAQAGGIGNYTGTAAASWSVAALAGGASISVNDGGVKVYDGGDVTDLFMVDTGTFPAGKTTVTYKYYDADENQLDAAPKNAGSYTVKATVSAVGYTPQTLEASLEVQKAEVTVYGTLFDDPFQIVTSYDGVPASELADFEANTSVDWTLDEETGAYVGTVNTTDEINDNYNFTIVAPSAAADRRDVNAAEISVTYTPQAMLEESGWTACDDVVVRDNKTGRTLVEGTDYVLNGNTTMCRGTFTIEVEGIGNYTGVRELEWKAVTAEDFEVTFTEHAPKPLDNGKTRVKLSFSAEPAEGFTIIAHGILYSNNGTITDAANLTLDAVDGNNIKQGANLYNASILDNGSGVVAVGYVTLQDAYGLTATRYTSDLGGKYALLALAQSVALHANPAAPLNNGKTRVQLGFAADVAEGYTVTAYGILYSNNGTISDISELTLDAVDGTNIKRGGNMYTANILDNGSGVIAVGYVIAEDANGNSMTFYSENLGANYAALVVDKFANALTFTENAPAPLNNGKTRVQLGFSAEAADGYTVTAYGILYSNNGTISDISELTLDAVDGTNIKRGGNMYTANILDNGSGVIAVGYVTLTDESGNTITLYTSDLGANYAALVADKFANALTFNENAPAAIDNGKTRVQLGFSAEAAEGFTVSEYGILYSNNGTISDVSELTLDVVDGANVKQGANMYTANILDNGSGVVAVGYVTMTDESGNSLTRYTADLGGSYAALSE